MKARRLKITPELWVDILSRPEGWEVIKNRLPEDAKLATLLVDDTRTCDPVSVVTNPLAPAGQELRYTVEIWVTSSVFLDTDPDDLPAPTIMVIPK